MSLNAARAPKDTDAHYVGLPEDQHAALVALAKRLGETPEQLLERILTAAIPRELVVTKREALLIQCRCCTDYGHCQKPFKWRDVARCGCGR